MPDLLDDVTAAAGLTVFGARAVAGLIATRTLPGAPPEWSPEPGLTFRVGALRAELRLLGLDRVVLVGDGPAARAAEAITHTLGVPLTVLDGTDPHTVTAALADRLQRTVVVQTSSSLAADSHRRAWLQAFEEYGVTDLSRRFVFVTAPGSPLAVTALEMGAELFLSPALSEPGVLSGLSAYSLVPAGLAGADVQELVDQAFAVGAPPRRRQTAGFAMDTLAVPTPAQPSTGSPSTSAHASASSTAAQPSDSSPPITAQPSEWSRSAAGAGSLEGSPVAALAAALDAGLVAGRDKLVLAADGSGILGIGEWVAALLAGSAPARPGASCTAVVLETPASWGRDGADVLSVTVGGVLGIGAMPGGGVVPDLAVNGPLGAQLFVWEQALRLAGWAGVDGSPGVAVEDVLRVLEAGLPPAAPAFVEGDVEVHGNVPASGGDTLLGVIDGFARAVAGGEPVLVHVHLDAVADAAAAGIRERLAARTGRAVGLRWGGGGSAGTGGTPQASIIQITGAVTTDLRVPGRPYTFGELQAAEAAGERQALLERGRPLLRLHVTDRKSGIDQLLAALGG